MFVWISIRDFIYIDDVVEAIYKVLKNEKSVEKY